jgi:hypothetical protein
MDYFHLLKEKMEKHEIELENTYNMDEKGFLIGWCAKQYRVFSKASKVRKGALHDSNREWITTLATICADGTPLTPALIYKGVAGQLQSSWVEQVTPSDNCYFAASPTGWTNDDIALAWMKAIFEPQTKDKARRKKRLLLVDGHGSHVNMRFLEYCHQHRIIVACYPPHTTHYLQPLDVGLFAPLALRYSQQLDAFTQRSIGLSKVSKRDFYPLFKPAFAQAFTADNIHSAFAKTGVQLFNPDVIVKELDLAPSSRPTTSTSSSFVN